MATSAVYLFWPLVLQYFKLFLGHINRNLEKLCRAASYVMVGELASQHGPCSNHGVDTIQRGLINWVYCWFCPRSEGFFFGTTSVFPSFPKNQHFQTPILPETRQTKNCRDCYLDVRLHRHLLVYPSTTDFHLFLINGRRGKTSPLAVLERFDCKQAF